MNTKDKGDLAELKVLTDLVEKGWKTAIPFGENQMYDLLAIRHDSGTQYGLEKHQRIQVKYVESDGEIIKVKCYTSSKKAGGILETRKYTREFIDIIAVYDRTTNACYYLHVALLGGGRAAIWLRLKPAKNGQEKGVRWAKDYVTPA